MAPFWGNGAGVVPVSRSFSTSQSGDRPDEAGAEAGRDRAQRTREFDYGTSDERDEAARLTRRTVAQEIRRAAADDAFSSPAVQAAYENAARLAEGPGAGSADEQPPHTLNGHAPQLWTDAW